MEFGCKSPVTSLLILFGLVWLTYHRNYELHLITLFLCSLWYDKGSLHLDPIFEHCSSEILKKRKIKVNRLEYELKFTTVFVILDLVCKHGVRQMKKFNGYYGCGLYTMRGVQKYPGSVLIRTMKLLQRVILGCTSTL